MPATLTQPQLNKITVTPEWVSPEQALKYYRSAAPEPLDRSKVALFQQLMSQGKHNPYIEMVGDNELINGRHRMMAAYKSGKPQLFVVTRGLPPEIKQDGIPDVLTEGFINRLSSRCDSATVRNFVTWHIDRTLEIHMDKPCGRSHIPNDKKCSPEKLATLTADLKAGDAGAKRRVAEGKKSAARKQALKREVERDRGKKPVEIDNRSLEDLFNDADRIGNKYQTREEREAFQKAMNREVSAVGDLIDKQFPDENDVVDYSKQRTKIKAAQPPKVLPSSVSKLLTPKPISQQQSKAIAPGKPSTSDPSKPPSLFEAKLKKGNLEGAIDQSLHEADQAKQLATRGRTKLRQAQMQIEHKGKEAIAKYPLIGEEDKPKGLVAQLQEASTKAEKVKQGLQQMQDLSRQQLENTAAVAQSAYNVGVGEANTGKTKPKGTSPALSGAEKRLIEYDPEIRQKQQQITSRQQRLEQLKKIEASKGGTTLGFDPLMRKNLTHLGDDPYKLEREIDKLQKQVDKKATKIIKESRKAVPKDITQAPLKGRSRGQMVRGRTIDSADLKPSKRALISALAKYYSDGRDISSVLGFDINQRTDAEIELDEAITNFVLGGGFVYSDAQARFDSYHADAKLTLAELRSKVKEKNATLPKGKKFKSVGATRQAMEAFVGVKAEPESKTSGVTKTKTKSASGKKFETSKVSSSIATAIARKTGAKPEEIETELRGKIQKAIDQKRKELKKQGKEASAKELRQAAQEVVKTEAKQQIALARGEIKRDPPTNNKSKAPTKEKESKAKSTTKASKPIQAKEEEKTSTATAKTPKKASGEKLQTLSKPDTTAESKIHSVKTQKEFNDLALHVYGKMEKKYSGLVPIYKIRREIGELVPRDKFREYMLNLQKADTFTFLEGTVEDSAPDKIRDSITTASGKLRCYAKITDRKALETVQRKSAQLENKLKDRPELNEVGRTVQTKSAPKIETQHQFNQVLSKVFKQIDEDTNELGLVKIHQLRDALGKSLSREQFDKMIGQMQREDKIQLLDEPGKSTPKEAIDGAWKSPSGKLRVYAKLLSS